MQEGEPGYATKTQPMQIAGAIGSVMVVATMIYMLIGSLGATNGSNNVNSAQRLSEIAETTGAEIASAAVSSGASVIADQYTVTDARLGSVTITVTTSGNIVTVTASTPAMGGRSAAFSVQ